MSQQLNQARKVKAAKAKAIMLGKPHVYRVNGFWCLAEFRPDIANMAGFKMAERKNAEAFYWTLRQPHANANDNHSHLE